MAEFIKKKNQDTGSALIGLFGINQEVGNFNQADKAQKYLFIEDKHHIGDQDLLDNEATKGENKSNMITFTVMFIIIAAGSVFCCYLNYYLDPVLSENVFFMFLVSFAGDIFGIRIVLLFLLSILKICCNCCQGYKRLKLDQKKVETNMGNAIKNMLMKNKEKRLSTKGYSLQLINLVGTRNNWIRRGVRTIATTSLD